MNIINQIKDEFNYQIDNFPIDDINNLANKIIEVNITNNIYFSGIGKSELIATHCCNISKSIGINAFNINFINSFHGDIGTIRENDLLILFSNSGNTIELINNIQIFKNRNIFIYGICCNKNSKFNNLIKTIICPLETEIYVDDFNKVPTNSIMSHLIFINMLTYFIILKNKNEKFLENYKLNHLGGNIGESLKCIKDLLIKEYPKLILKNYYNLNEILLEMTKYSIGIVFFVDKNDILYGILSDGDIRRILLNNSSLIINKDNINTNYIYENNLNKLKIELNNNGKFIPVLDNTNKILGIIR